MTADLSTATSSHQFRSASERAAFRFFVDIDGDGLAYERVVFDLAAKGIAVRSRGDSVAGRWQLLAVVADETAMPDAVARLGAYFGPRFLGCDDEVMAVHGGGKLRAMKLAAATALADLATPDLTATQILPDVLDPRVVPAVAKAVAGASANRTGTH